MRRRFKVAFTTFLAEGAQDVGVNRIKFSIRNNNIDNNIDKSKYPDEKK